MFLGALAAGPARQLDSPSGRCSVTPLQLAHRARRSASRRRVRACSGSAAAAASGRWRAPPAAGRSGRAPRAAGARRRTAGCGPARLLGLPVVWVAVCLVVLPARRSTSCSYMPVGDDRGPPARRRAGRPGHTGQTLLDLTGQMYRYHNGLTAAHAASSPWWAWPLEPQAGLVLPGGPRRRRRRPSLYDAGSLVIWWLGIPAMAFVAHHGVQAAEPRPGPHRRSGSRPSGSRGRASTARRSSTTTTRRCRSWSWPSPTSWPSCGTGRRAGPGCSARLAAGRRDRGPGGDVAARRGRCARSSAWNRSTRAPQACPAVIPDGSSSPLATLALAVVVDRRS